MTARRPQHGFGLAEVLVALALGLLLVLVVTTLHARILRLSLDTSAAADAQDALRIAMSVLEHELVHAGYWGPLPGPELIEGRAADTAPLAVAVSGDCGPGWSIDLDRALQAWSAGWPLACAPYRGASSLGGLLVVRRLLPRQGAAEAGVLQVQGDFWGGRLVAGGEAPPPGQEVRDLVARAYYVSPHSTGTTGRPSLRRKTLQRGPRVIDEEVMPGIAMLELELGIDHDPPDSEGHGLPDSFVAPGTATAPVVAVRVTLRSAEASGLTLTRTIPLPNGPVR
ncbi:MAG: prepilin-type N-terminal cleavage/methylation domain-containing protein [Gammaproteobacteria bacterium]|jgi:hypothetical protein